MTHEVAQDALERVYREQGTTIWRGVYAFSGGRRDIADDAVAEAFARALEQSDKIRDPVPWLYRVAFRQAAKALRNEHRAARQSPEIGDPYVVPDSRAESIGALRILPQSQRAVVFLFYYADMSVEQISRVRGTTAVAVRVQLHRARQALRHNYDNASPMMAGHVSPQGGGNHERMV